MRVVGTYRGPIYKIQRESDGATLDISPPLSSQYGAPSSASILAWAAGSVVMVTQVYDQSGNGHPWVQATTVAMPQLNFDGPYPVFYFPGYRVSMDGTATMTGFAQNSTGVTVVAARQNFPQILTFDRPLVFMTNGTGSSARLEMGSSATTGTDATSTKSIDGGSQFFSTGFAVNSGWSTEIGRWDYTNGKAYHNRDALSETTNITAGASSNTASTTVTFGGNPADTRIVFGGCISVIALIGRSITDTETANLIAALANYQVPRQKVGQFVDWGATALQGNYTLAPGAPGASTAAILNPSGATPTPADLLSHRYHHHTRTLNHNGRQWVGFSSSLDGEDESGQLTALMSTFDGGATWTGPAIAIPSQSTMTSTIGVTANRICQSNGFYINGGSLFFVSAITSGDSNTGLALAAVQCNDDGSIGSPFLITTAAYAPLGGFTAISYDAVNGPPLLAQAKIYGRWGGSIPGFPPIEFAGWFTQGGNSQRWTEPVTYKIDGTGLNLQRLMRKTAGNNMMNFWWSSLSTDGGVTWGPIYPTNLPNSPSAGGGLRLPDGRIALVFNPIDHTTNRDPLALALFSGTTGALVSMYGIWQGQSATPVYAGAAKSGGASYADISFDGTYLWISASLHKESVVVAKIALAGL
jgi:hypothetical protein